MADKDIAPPSTEESIAQSIVPSVRALAYLAGIVDGEGSINIKRQDAKFNPQYKLLLRIANTSIELLEHLREDFASATIPSYKGRAG